MAVSAAAKQARRNHYAGVGSNTGNEYLPMIGDLVSNSLSLCIKSTAGDKFCFSPKHIKFQLDGYPELNVESAVFAGDLPGGYTSGDINTAPLVIWIPRWLVDSRKMESCMIDTNKPTTTGN